MARPEPPVGQTVGPVHLTLDGGCARVVSVTGLFLTRGWVGTKGGGNSQVGEAIATGDIGVTGAGGQGKDVFVEVVAFLNHHGQAMLDGVVVGMVIDDAFATTVGVIGGQDADRGPAQPPILATLNQLVYCPRNFFGIDVIVVRVKEHGSTTEARVDIDEGFLMPPTMAISP